MILLMGKSADGKISDVKVTLKSFKSSFFFSFFSEPFVQSIQPLVQDSGFVGERHRVSLIGID